VQQVKIEMIGAETGQTRLASAYHAIARRVLRQHLGDQEYVVAPAGNHATNQLLRVAVAVYFGGVDQRHPERNAGAQRIFFFSCRMSSLAEMPRALTERWDDGAVAKFYRSPPSSCCINGQCA
jgi:hypothetical protein